MLNDGEQEEIVKRVHQVVLPVLVGTLNLKIVLKDFFKIKDIVKFRAAVGVSF